MKSITIAASPLTYSEYKKMMLADLRTRHLFQYIGLPILSLILLIIVAVIVADEGIATTNWQYIMPLLLIPAGSALIWIATWLSLRQKYRRAIVLSDGVVYRLNEQEIVQENNPQEPALWSNIARTAKQSGQWILLRNAAATSGETYFLNTAGVIPPASRDELLALLKSKRIKPI